MKKWLIIGLIVAAIAVAAWWYMKHPKKNTTSDISFLGQDAPRGVRNNNPGNIKISPTAWEGKVSNNTDGTFEQFEAWHWGLRAMIKTIKSYIEKRGLRTLREIIDRWANQASPNYLTHIQNQVGQLDEEFVFNKENMRRLAVAISRFESGAEAEYATQKEFEKSWKLL